MLSSCTSNDDLNTAEELDNVPYVVTSISNAMYSDTKEIVTNKIENTTRALGEEFTEAEAQELMQPFVQDGANVRSQILGLSEELELSDEDVELLNGMDESQLAELSVALNGIEQEFINNSLEVSYTWEDVADCLMQATGISSIGDLVKDGLSIQCVKNLRDGTKALIDAKGALNIAKAIGKRTLGVVGVVWMLYDFGDCLLSKK